MGNTDRLESLPPLLFEPDFSFIAVKAASELERHAVHGESVFDAAHQLGEILRSSIQRAEIPVEGGQPKALSLITPTMAGVYHQAFDAVVFPGDVGLPEKTEGVAEALRAASATMSRDESERLRDFCIALAENALGTVDLHVQY